MQCPRDHHPLGRETLHDVAIDVCSHCDGVWLDRDELGKLVRSLSVEEVGKGEELWQMWQEFDSDGHTLPKDFWQEEYLTCPNHRVQMKKHYFAGSTIGVDHCEVCGGFWLAGEELAAIAKYVEPNPTLDRAGRLMVRALGEQLDTTYPDLNNPFEGSLMPLHALGHSNHFILIAQVIASFLLDLYRNNGRVDRV